MTPFASVAMLEKLALLKIARCRAPAWSSVSSACLRAVLSVLSKRPIRVLVTSFPLAMVCPGNVYSSHLADRLRDFKTRLRTGVQLILGVDVACMACKGIVH